MEKETQKYADDEKKRKLDFEENNEKEQEYYGLSDYLIFKSEAKRYGSYINYSLILLFLIFFTYNYFGDSFNKNIINILIFTSFISGCLLIYSHKTLFEIISIKKNFLKEILYKINDENYLKCPFCSQRHDWKFESKDHLNKHFKSKHILSEEDEFIYKRYIEYNNEFYEDVNINYKHPDGRIIFKFEEIYKIPTISKLIKNILNI